MSELIQQDDNRTTIRWKLLTGASAMALTAYVASAALAKAEDANRPLLWIELGGQMELMQGAASNFSAPFMSIPSPNHAYGSKSFGERQGPPRFAFGENGSITFQPEDSDWVFSAAIRYGRSHNKKHSHYQTEGLQIPLGPTYPGVYAKARNRALSDVSSPHSESHAVVDFQAGKDVGLGLLGRGGKSTISAGVRFAQFSLKSGTKISARPSVYGNHASKFLKYSTYFRTYHLKGHQARSFKGIGPSISWKSSAVLAGNPDHGELMLDFGVDGAVLFGRQKAKTDHKTSAFKGQGAFSYYALYPARTYNAPERSRRMTVPEVSGFIGLSAKLPNSKISIGYRGDIWFKAVDRGIDERKTSNLTFNGPYASVSFGLGD